jgi:glycogen phosphorylase
VLVNGGLNLSELDGWWAEAYLAEAGWALGDGAEHTDTAAWDEQEAQQLYRLLETEIVPSFYRRDERGLPREWIGRMRESMAHLTTQYSSNRMLREYTERYYLPLAEAFKQRAACAAELEQWHAQLARHWPRIHFGNVACSSDAGQHHFEVQVYLEELDPQAVRVELYADADADAHGAAPLCVPLTLSADLVGASNAHRYSGAVPAARPAADYTPRVVPYHPQAAVPLEASFILWYR